MCVYVCVCVFFVNVETDPRLWWKKGNKKKEPLKFSIKGAMVVFDKF